jgi:hypothetical protein
VARDLDGDQQVDIWLGGNFYGLKPESGRHDSSRGVFLKGDGKGNFVYMPTNRSGINVFGEVRDAICIEIKNKPTVLVARNNREALLFTR